MSDYEKLFDAAFQARYDVLGTIGVGGAGQVFKANQSGLDRMVAVKFLNPRLFTEEDAVARFEQEGEIASRLIHPNIVQVFDVGKSNGFPYIVYELMEGQDLAEIIQREGALSIERACTIIEAVAEGLSYAHEAKIIHRDLKAENILVEESGKIKVADFGIAKLLAGGRIKTETGVVLGTPAYMSPEQVRGEMVSPRSDLYALGIIFFEMLTGRLPFWGKTPMETALKQLHNEAPVIEAPEGGNRARRLDLLIRRRLLAKDPDDRFASAGEFVKTLRQLSLCDEEAFDEKKELARIGAAKSPTVRLKARERKKGRGRTRPTIRRVAPEKDIPSNTLRTLGMALLVAAVVAAGFGAMYFFSKDAVVADEKTGLNVEKLRCETGLYTADLFWHSDRAYPSLVRVWPKGSEEDAVVIKGAGGSRPVKEHEVHIEDLSQSTVYQYEMILPGGARSFRRQFSTRGSKLLQYSARWLSPARIEIETATASAHIVKVILRVAGERLSARSTRAKQRHRFTFDVPGAEYECSYDLLFFAHDDDEAPSKFKRNIVIPSYLKELRRCRDKFVATVDALNIDDTLAALRASCSKSSDLKSSVVAFSDRVIKNVKSPLGNFRKYVDYFFTAQGFTCRNRYLFFKAVQDLRSLNQFLRASGCGNTIGLDGLLGGDWISSEKSRLREVVFSADITFSDQYRRFRELRLFRDPEKRRYPEKILVVHDDHRRSGLAEMELEIQGLPDCAFLTMTINKSWKYRFTGSGHWFQGIALPIIREGENGFSFQVGVQPGFDLERDAFVLKKALLRLGN